MDQPNFELSPEVRARLAEKGRILYGKDCSARGKASCAESFVRHHIERGRPEVARDLLAYLHQTINTLSAHDPAMRLATTLALASRIRQQLEHEGEKPLDPSPPERVACKISGMANPSENPAQVGESREP